jgi:hypothetical protein
MSQAIVEHRTPANTLSAKSLKATLVLTPAEVLSLSAPDGKPRCVVRVHVAGSRTVTADLNAKSVRKAIATIREAGADNVACILQGRLGAKDELLDAGLAVTVKIKAETPTLPC